MSLLVSQVEFLGNKIEYPFTHQFRSDLSNITTAMETLEKNETIFSDRYEVIDGVAYGILDITFNIPEQIIAFLRFESSVLVAEMIETGIGSSEGAFHNADAANPIAQMRTSYERIIRNFITPTPPKNKVPSSCKVIAVRKLNNFSS